MNPLAVPSRVRAFSRTHSTLRTRIQASNNKTIISAYSNRTQFSQDRNHDASPYLQAQLNLHPASHLTLNSPLPSSNDLYRILDSWLASSPTPMEATRNSVTPEVGGKTPSDRSAEIEQEERSRADRETEPIAEKDRLNEENPTESFKQWRDRPEQKRHREELDKYEDMKYGSSNTTGMKEGEEWVGFEEPVEGVRVGQVEGENPIRKNVEREVGEGGEQHWVWGEDELHENVENAKGVNKKKKASRRL